MLFIKSYWNYPNKCLLKLYSVKLLTNTNIYNNKCIPYILKTTRDKVFVQQLTALLAITQKLLYAVNAIYTIIIIPNNKNTKHFIVIK